MNATQLRQQAQQEEQLHEFCQNQTAQLQQALATNKAQSEQLNFRLAEAQQLRDYCTGLQQQLSQSEQRAHAAQHQHLAQSQALNVQNQHNLQAANAQHQQELQALHCAFQNSAAMAAKEQESKAREHEMELQVPRVHPFSSSSAASPCRLPPARCRPPAAARPLARRLPPARRYGAYPLSCANNSLAPPPL